MGHELTHAFDVDGKGYNEVGNAISWWLPKDNRAYNAKTRAIINLYEKAKYQGHSVNGALTLSENIADL
jgi:putative endopeptidase